MSCARRCPAIVVMVKAPIPGTVKTRLTCSLSTHQAAELASCFIEDVVAQARTIVDHVLIACTPPDGRGLLESILPSGLLWIDQCGGSLGDRMEAAITHAEEQGFSPVVVIGMDSPTLPAHLPHEAIRRIEANEADVVFVPAEDGGYCLLGVRAAIPGLFRDVAWSSQWTLQHTIRNARERDFRIAELATWYDVDTLADLRRLHAEIESSGEARRRAPRTSEWLRRVGWL